LSSNAVTEGLMTPTATGDAMSDAWYSYRLRTEPWQHPPAGYRVPRQRQGSSVKATSRWRSAASADTSWTTAGDSGATHRPRRRRSVAPPSSSPASCQPQKRIKAFSFSAHLSCQTHWEFRQNIYMLYDPVIGYLLWRWRTKFRVGGGQNLQERKKRMVKRGQRATVSCVLLVSK